MSNIGSIGGPQFQDINKAKPHAHKPTNNAQAEPKDNVSIGANSDAAPADKKKWTVLLYSAADTNLERYQLSDVAELEGVGSNNNMNLVAQLDRGKNPSSLSGGWPGCKRFYLDNANHKPGDKQNITSPALADLGQVNMSDPKVLADFIEWGVKNYPAENYMLVMSDHGGAWVGAMQDYSHKGFMSIPQLKEGLAAAEKATGEKIDVLGFDACVMANTEVADELKDSVDYMVASEKTIGGDGWTYNGIFSSKTIQNLQKALDTKFTISPEEVAKKIIKDSTGWASTETLSAIDMSKMKDVTSASDAFAKELLAGGMTQADLKELARKSKDFDGFTDQYDFVEKIINSPKADDKLKTAGKAVMDAIKNAVIAEEHASSENGAHGLTVQTYGDGLGFGGVNSSKYQELQFAKNTQWDEAIQKKA